MTGARGSKNRRRASSRSSRHDAANGKVEKEESERHTSVINDTTVSNGFKVSNGSIADTESSESSISARSRTRNVSSKTQADDAAQATPQLAQTRASSDAEQEEASEDPGSTVTIFCRRDFKRYLRWKHRELANQDDERRKEEKNRSRKTFSSIIADTAY